MRAADSAADGSSSSGGSATSDAESSAPTSHAEPLHALSMDDDDFGDDYNDGDYGDGDRSFSYEEEDAEEGGSESSSSSSRPPPLKSTNVPSLVSAIMAAGTTGGTTYAFGLYASALKHTLHLSQSELDTISSSFFCAGLLSWAPGMAVDRFGPRFTTAAGGVLGAVTLLSYWAVATGTVPVPRNVVVTVLSVLGIACFVSSALVTGSVFKVIVASTGKGTKGTAVGAAKGYVGLGSGAYACIFEAIRSPVHGTGSSSSSGSGGGDPSDLNFLPMAAFFAVAVGTIPALFLLPSKSQVGRKRDAATSLHFRVVYAGLLGLGSVVVGTSVLSLWDEAESSKKSKSHGDHRHNATDAAFGFDRDIDVDTLDVVDRGTLLEQQQEEEFDVGFDDGGGLSGFGVGEGGSGGGGGGRDYAMAILIVAMWFGPILSMLCMPHGNGAGGEETSSLSERARMRRGDLMTGKKSSSRRRRGKHGRVEVSQSEDDDDEEDVDCGLLPPSRRGDDDGADGMANSSDESSDVEGGGGSSSSARRGSTEDDQEEQLLAGGDRPAQTKTSSSSSSKRQVENLTLTQMLRTVPSWLLLWTCTILAGGGTVITNNVGQMVEALRLDPTTASASLALFSAAQAASRVMTGALSESALRWSWYVPRPAFLVIASFGGCMSHLVLATATTEVAFVIGVALSGAAFGMIWPLMVLIVGECFGTAHVGANYMFYDGVTSAIGTLILSKFVAQEVYESHITKHNDDDGLTCYGEGCFELSHFIIAGLSVSCVISSVILLYKTRYVYERD